MRVTDEYLWDLGKTFKRRNRLTAELTHALCTAIVRGAHHLEASRVLGIPDSTYNDWFKRGEREPDSIYERFRDCVKQAKSVRDTRRVQKIEDLGDVKDDWRAQAHILKCQSREIYGDTAQPLDDTKQVTGASFDPAQLDALPEEDKRVLERILKKLAGEATSPAAGFTGSVHQLPAKEPAK